ncbi:choice-of-anchor Q domain-containing protein [Parahaliea maris]|nr:choice-of-anchor Q domain-containing protein [Parahaliea maris]
MDKNRGVIVAAGAAIACATAGLLAVNKSPGQPPLPPVALPITKPPLTLPEDRPGEIQATFRVTALTDSGEGSLRAAILAANASPGPDQIVFESDDGLYSSPQTISLESPLPTVTDDLVIDGYIEDMLWKASGVTIDASGQHAILQVSANTLVKLRYLTLSHGNADRGGAIFSEGDLVVESSTFDNNRATDQGGAIYASGLLTFVINSTFYDNSADQGGGALALTSGQARVTHATFTNNSAPRGAAVLNEASLGMGNSILANSLVGSDCFSSRPLEASLHNIIESDSGCGEPYSREDPVLGNPDYFNGPTRTINLGMRSPATNYGARDASVNEYGQPLRWDQRGNGDPRDAAGVVDIGAFETQAQNKVIVDTAEDVDYRWCVVFKNDCSLRGAMLLANNDFRFPVITFDDKIFAEKTTLTLNGDLPSITTAITLDASGTGGITLQAKENSSLCTASELLSTVNITLECD